MARIDTLDIKSSILLGNWDRDYDSLKSSISLTYTLETVHNKWDFSGLIADFIAYYFSYFLEDMDFNRILFIVNELIENAFKYVKDKSSLIEIDICRGDNLIILKVTNEVSSGSYQAFKDFIVSLFNSDPSEFYMKRIEDLSSNSKGAGIGLTLLKKDYLVNLCFKFFTTENGFFVTVYTLL